MLHYGLNFFDRFHAIIFLLLDGLKLQIFAQLLPQKVFLSLVVGTAEVFGDQFVLDLIVASDRHIELVSHRISLLSMN